MGGGAQKGIEETGEDAKTRKQGGKEIGIGQGDTKEREDRRREVESERAGSDEADGAAEAETLDRGGARARATGRRERAQM